MHFIADLNSRKRTKNLGSGPLYRAVTGLAASGIFIIIHFLFREDPACSSFLTKIKYSIPVKKLSKMEKAAKNVSSKKLV
jgi:hypothetical protein